MSKKNTKKKAVRDNSDLPSIIKQSAGKGIKSLTLSGRRIRALPSEIGLLKDLTDLHLNNNLLTTLPSEIKYLTNLSVLDLSNNKIATLPPEIAYLSNLSVLYLNRNQLKSLPPEIARLTKLSRIYLSNNKLKSLSTWIGHMADLLVLDLGQNQLGSVPSEIGQLSKLNVLYISHNRLKRLPKEFGRITSLRELHLGDNQLEGLPSEIGLLRDIIWLEIQNNKLKSLPSEIGQLKKLSHFLLHNNLLNELPSEIGQLTNLPKLDLSNNQLHTLPPQIGLLTNLSEIHLDNNQLNSLPPELGNLTKLKLIRVEGNSQTLTSPPPEIIEQATPAILAYLRQRLEESSRQWVSKLLVVGEGGVGKTSLLRALRREPFKDFESTTHGIEIRSLELAHPTKPDVSMQLNTWDFGGQDIYHATHQFFLTNRSLFLLVWNARHGFEQGRLYYWLNTIQALAPESPVLLIATWTDERDADIPLSELRIKYPQIIGQCKVSNRTGAGIEALREKLSVVAADLPLMGEIWPTNWLNAANTIRATSAQEKYITPRKLWEIMTAHGVNDDSVGVLARWLHELGDILYFPDTEDLCDTIILRPQWVTEYISKVLESEEVTNRCGVFTRIHMNKLWYDIDPVMREHFLLLMERFDLSYRTLENQEISIVVERLPRDQPQYQQAWDSVKENGDCNEISMKFVLNTIPAGIPTWFIARSHRFTTHTHWRTGALFAYEPERKHLALVQAFPHERYVQLSVRGQNPQNFFALLKDGIEVTLARFPGLQITRLIPCPGHDGRSCVHEFDYEQLLKRVNKKPVIECPESLEDVSVTGLIFGLHGSTQNAVLSRLNELETAEVERHEEVLSAIENLRVLAQREFTSAFRREQAKIDSHCPNVFILRPKNTRRLPASIDAIRGMLAGQTFELQLLCQAPGCWHPTEEGGLYEIKDAAYWVKELRPYLKRLVSVLKYASPLVGPWLGVVTPSDYEKHFKNDVELMNALVTKLPEIICDSNTSLRDDKDTDDVDKAEGAVLRSLRVLLEEKDPRQEWGGLQKVLTPEGHYLWLCNYHKAEYMR